MTESTERALAVVICTVLVVAWIVNPGLALLLIGGAIGGLTILVWVARRLGI